MGTMTGTYENRTMATSSRTVTNLARDAKELLAGPVDPRLAESVLREIDELADHWSFAPEAPIHLWLNNLRREVARRS